MDAPALRGIVRTSSVHLNQSEDGEGIHARYRRGGAHPCNRPMQGRSGTYRQSLVAARRGRIVSWFLHRRSVKPKPGRSGWPFA